MVDSIIFRIHDLKLHHTLADFLDKPDGGVHTFTKSIDDPELRSREVHIKRYFLDVKTGRSWSELYRNFIQSHHYHIAYSINTELDFIEFNLSLPKYHYGNNVMQLVDHLQEKNYLHYRNNSFWDCKKQAFEKFVSVLTKFVEKELGGYYDQYTSTGVVHKTHVEIRRLDLCFNLVFNTEADTLFYLNEIKHIKKRGIRDTSSIQNNYHSGIYFSSSDFTIKVYRKGTEFKKHDYSKIKKRFGAKVADEIYHRGKRVLRYEVEFRPGYMTELVLTNLKNTNPLLYKCLMISRQVSKTGYFYYNDQRYNFHGQPVSGKTCKKVTPDLAQMLKNGNYIRKRNFAFMGSLNTNFSIESLGLTDVVDQYSYRELFSFELFCLMVDSFKKHFLHYQLGSLDHLNIMANAIEENKIRKAEQASQVILGKKITHHTIDKGKINMLIHLLNTKTWSEIKEMSLFSDRTFYRYKKFFVEQLGMKAQKNHFNDFKLNYTYSNYFDLVFDLQNMLTVLTPVKHSDLHSEEDYII